MPFKVAPTNSPRAVIRSVASIAFAALAAAIAWFGIRINAWYGGTLGKTAEASSLIAGLSVCADLLARALPATARIAWVDGHRVGAGIAWALWAVTIVITLMATIGFAALNVTDTVATRSRIAAESAALTARIERCSLSAPTLPR